MQQPNNFSLSLTAICSCLRLIHQYNLKFGHICGKQGIFSRKLKSSHFYPDLYSFFFQTKKIIPLLHVDTLAVIAGELALRAGGQLDQLHLQVIWSGYDHLLTWSFLIIWAGQYDDLMPWWSEYLRRILSVWFISPLTVPLQHDICRHAPQRSQCCAHLKDWIVLIEGQIFKQKKDP